MNNDISVVLTTYNGEASLPATLDRLKKFNIPRKGIELLLVDNASDDGTPAILKAFADTHGGRVLHEPARGKSHGLNRALAEATGEFLVFIDDDVKIDANWLSAFREAARNFPKAIVFSGQIRPDWVSAPQDWQQYLTDRGRSEGCTPLDRSLGSMRPNWVKGANMMVRRSEVGELKFDVQKSNFDGSKKSHGGEDTNFALSAAPEEGQCVFVPQAIVYHRVDPKMLTWRAVFSRYWRIGNVIGKRPNAKRPPLGQIRQYFFQFVSKWVTGRQGEAAHDLTTLAQLLGRRHATRKRQV